MKEAVEMAQGNQSNRNRGRYGQDFSAPPKQGENESRADYNQRLKEWQRRRSMSGGKAGTQTTAQPKSKPAAKSQKKESRSEEHTSELQSLMRNSNAVLCLKKKNKKTLDQIQMRKSIVHSLIYYRPRYTYHTGTTNEFSTV